MMTVPAAAAAPADKSARQSYRLGLVYVTIAVVAWSLGGLFAKIVSVDGYTTLCWRGFFGFASLALVLAVRERGNVFKQLTNMGVGGWLYALFSASAMAFYLISIQYTSIAHNSIIWSLVPLATAVAAWVVLRERASVSTVVASLIAFAGVVVMLVGSPGEGDVLGDALSFLMMLFGVATILVPRRYPGIPFMTASMVAALISCLIALPFATPLAATPWDLAVLATFGIVQGAVGMVLFGMGARLIPSAESALISALEGPLGPLWVFLALGTMPMAATFVGGGIVLAAVIGHILLESWREAALPG
jgi:drug/metabolite transporter (DMT)-like permease